MFTKDCNFTDDTVLTCATAEAVLNGGSYNDFEDAYYKWAKMYPNAGYGLRFIEWLNSKERKPYNSYGNGSAMRVSPIGWAYDSLRKTRNVARVSASVTHNHEEGIKGAECVASVIWLARNDAAKDSISMYVEGEFGYDLSESLDDMRARHEHIETCMNSVPKALVSFLEGNDFEDVIRNAVSLGGDTDTIGAIAGSIAEAYYAVPANLAYNAMYYIDRNILDMILKTL